MNVNCKRVPKQITPIFIQDTHLPVRWGFVIKHYQSVEICSTQLKFSTPSTNDAVRMLVFVVGIHRRKRSNFCTTWFVFLYGCRSRQNNLENPHKLPIMITLLSFTLDEKKAWLTNMAQIWSKCHFDESHLAGHVIKMIFATFKSPSSHNKRLKCHICPILHLLYIAHLQIYSGVRKMAKRFDHLRQIVTKRVFYFAMAKRFATVQKQGRLLMVKSEIRWFGTGVH